MKNKMPFMGLIAIVCCLLLSNESFSQVTSPEEYVRIRRAREAEESRKRQVQQEQEKERNKRASTPAKPQYSPVVTQTGTTDKSKNHFLAETPDANGLFSKMEWEKWGLVDKQGKQIVPLIYNRISDPTGKLYIAWLQKDPTNWRSTKAGIINAEGNIVIDFLYDNIRKGFENGKVQVELGDKMFFIDEKGNTIAGTVEISPKGKADQAYELQVAMDKANALSGAEKNFQLGILNQQLKKWKEALEFYKLAGYPKEPSTTELNLRAASCIFEMEAWEGSDQSLTYPGIVIERHIKEGNKDPILYYYTGIARLREYETSPARNVSQIAEALHFFKTYESKKTTSTPELWINRLYGDCYFKKGDYDSAIYHYLKQARLFPEDWKTTWRAIAFYQDRGELTKAGEFAKSVITFMPAAEKAHTFFIIGWRFADKGDYANALFYTEMAITNHVPVANNHQIYRYNFLRAFCNFKTGKYEAALKELVAVIDLPDEEYSANFEFFYLCGMAYAALGKKQEACAAWSGLEYSYPKMDMFITKKDYDDAWKTCSKKMRKAL